MNGFINVLKPPGMTSHDVVYYIRKTLNIKKVGHTGTLDPNAAGVLPICIGKATKVSQYLINKNKKYRAELTLGIATDSQDLFGEIINESNKSVSDKDIRYTINKFIGEIDQTPPMFSAIKHKGKKLYEYAREGEEIKVPSRKVTINKIDIISILDNSKILFDVDCSKGTYIRTLCNDIGMSLGTYGVMSFLLRSEVENFNIKNAYTLEEIKNISEQGMIEDIIFPIDFPLVNYDKLELDKKYFKILTNGGKIPLSELPENTSNTIKNELLRIYCNCQFIGFGSFKEYNNEIYLKMEKVLF